MTLLDRVRASVSYDAETGVFRRLTSAGRRKAGDIAGYVKSDGYRLISIDSRWHYAHRLAWLLTHGHLPDGEIDHINGSRDDNRLANLRECSRSQNMMNVSRRGCHWHKKRQRWQAMIRVAGKRKYLGSFLSESEARATYAAAAFRLHGQYRCSAPDAKQEALGL